MDTIRDFHYNLDNEWPLYWQHANAKILQCLILAWIEKRKELVTDFYDSWVEDVFNINTANEFGLSVWSIILDIPITIEIPAQQTVSFGFGPFRRNFNNGNFGAGGVSALSKEDARRVLKLRYYQLITKASVTEANAIIKNVFGDLGQSYVIDRYNMTATYVFNFTLDSALLEIIKDFDLLPRPAGVKIDILYFPGGAFGFGPNRANFDNGRFRA